ncbi:MAG: NAD-binding protein [Acidobacteriota bacterium]
MTPDVLIIGGGIVGCACAHALAAAGVRVGLRPAGPDALPLIGRSSTVPGLVYEE